MSERTGRDGASLARYALVIGAAAYLLEYLFAHHPWTLLDEGILAVHEAGHVLFRPFGEFLMMLGGSLLQLLVPAAFVLYFMRRQDRYAAAVVGFWLAASLFNLAAYVGDARAGELPLITGSRSDHDWTWLLIRLHALEHDVLFGRMLRALAFVTYVAAIVFGLYYAAPRASTAADAGQALANSSEPRTGAGTSSRRTGTKP